MLQLIKRDLTIRPAGKVIKSAEYQTLAEAEQIISAAREEAALILAAAEEEHERQKERGYREGLVEGRLQMAEKMVDSVSHTVDYLEKLEGKVVDIVMRALKKILGDMDNKDVVERVARGALDVARSQAGVTLKACPAEAEHLRSRVDEILRDYPGVDYINIQTDSRLTPGSCVLETEVGVVDASVDVQIEAIRNSLLRTIEN